MKTIISTTIQKLEINITEGTNIGHKKWQQFDASPFGFRNQKLFKITINPRNYRNKKILGVLKKCKKFTYFNRFGKETVQSDPIWSTMIQIRPQEAKNGPKCTQKWPILSQMLKIVKDGHKCPVGPTNLGVCRTAPATPSQLKIYRVSH